MKRLPLLQTEFFEDLQYWVRNDPKVAERLFRIMEECLKTPFHGIGKPEPLKSMGSWSRRLTDVDRVVYIVNHSTIDFLQARFHYD